MAGVLTLCALFMFSVFVASQEPTAISARLVKQARKVQNYCKNQVHVKEELIEQARRNIFANDRELKCFLQCNLDIGGVMNSKNEITLEPLQQILPEDWFMEFSRIGSICGTKAGADACEIAYNTVLCFAEHNKKYPMLL